MLIVVAALWRQLDYHAKWVMPWAEMAKGPTTPEKSVLLDYISPLLLIAMYRSLRNGHFVVSTSITVFIAIKVIAVFSTGLFVLQNVLVNAVPTNLLVANVFDPGNFGNWSTSQRRAALTVHGIQKSNLPFPKGTTTEYAFQSFEAAADSPASTSAILNGTVEYFTADIDCEVGDLSYTVEHYVSLVGSASYTNNSNYNVSISATNCHVNNAYLDRLFSGTIANNSSAGYYALAQRVYCTDGGSGRDDARRLLISIGYPRLSNFTETAVKKSMKNVTGILCTPRYGIRRAIIIQNTTTADQQYVNLQPLEERSHPLTGVSPWDIAEGVLSAIEYADPEAPAGYSSFPTNPVAVHNASVTVDSFFGLFLSASPDVPLSAYMDPQNLTTASQRTFRFLAAQVVHQNLMSPQPHVIQGSFSDHIDRIMVQKLPLRVMQGLFSAVILMTTAMGLLMPHDSLTGSATCIGFHISVFGRSTEALNPLERSGVCTIGRIRQILSFYRFQTDVVEVGGRSEFRILLTIRPATDRMRQSLNCSNWYLSRERWWRPFAFSFPAMSFTLLTPPIFIVLLELLLQYSDKHQGLADVELKSRYSYVWLFIPTLLLVLVATLFNMLEFEIENIHPFQILRRQTKSARNCILNNPLSKLTPLVLWEASRSRDFTLVVAAISVVFAPFLPIIASGLYNIQNIGGAEMVQIQQIERFQNLSEGLQQDNMTLAVIPTLIAQQNLTYPQWTYNEIAIPKVSLDHLKSTANIESIENAASVTMQISALRGAMNCSVLPESRIDKAMTGIYWVPAGTFMEFELNVGPNCSNRGYDAPSRGLFDLTSWPNMSGYLGQEYGLYTDSVASGSPCADFQALLFFGYVENNQTKALHFLTCAPYTEQLDVHLSLMLPSYSVSAVHPPKVIESSARVFSKDSFLPRNIPSRAEYDPLILDGFFQMLMFGKDAIPGDELVGNTTRLIEAVEHQYRVFAAQAYNFGFRIPFDSGSNRNDSPTINATLINSSRSRIVQSNTSTRILQALLGVLFICAVIIYTILWRSTNGTFRILPHSPTSIAIMATLLAGSKMMTTEKLNIPPGTEFMTNKEMEKSGIFDGWLFSLGWWDTDKADKQRYGIDIGRATQERDKDV